MESCQPIKRLKKKIIFDDIKDEDLRLARNSSEKEVKRKLREN
jgi:hypothetical protein